MGVLRGISIDCRQKPDLTGVFEQVQETGFDTILVVIENESRDAWTGGMESCVEEAAKRGLRTVAYLADGNRGLKCLSVEEELDRKVADVTKLAGSGVSGIIFRGFATDCYTCESCAENLRQSKGLKLPPGIIGNPAEAKKWYSPDPMTYGFDNPYNRANRIEEILVLAEWMGDRLKAVASRMAGSVSKSDPDCSLGLVGMSPIALKVLDAFSLASSPICVLNANTYTSSDELDLYIDKFPFEGVRDQWTNLISTSAYYHSSEEMARIILKAAVRGRYGTIIWAANGLHLSFGRLRDITLEHWRAARESFALIRSHEEECEEAEGAAGMYWTKKGRLMG